MVGDLLGSVVGHVADDHAMAAGRLEIDVVVAHAGPDHALAPRCPGKAGLSQAGNVVKEHDRVGPGQVTGQLFLASRPAEHERRDVVEHGRLDRRSRQESRQRAPCSGRDQAWATPSNQKRKPSHGSDIVVRARPRPPELGMTGARPRGFAQGLPPWFRGTPGCSVQASSATHGSGRSAPFILKHEPGGRKKRMPRIKQLLAEGQVVRVFAAGQLLSPKLIEIVGEHGEFDALWLDAEHAGIGMKDDRAGHHGREGLRNGPLRAAAGDRLCLGHAPSGSRRGRAHDQHGPFGEPRPSRRSAGPSSGRGASAGSTAGIATAGSA